MQLRRHKSHIGADVVTVSQVTLSQVTTAVTSLCARATYLGERKEGVWSQVGRRYRQRSHGGERECLDG